MDLHSHLRTLGGFFELTDPRGTDAVPWSQLLADEPLAARCATVRRAMASNSGLALDTIDPKVAVSALQVGLASRLWSVALACAVGHGWVPDLSSTNLLGSPGHGGAAPLALTDPERGYALASLDEAARTISDTVVHSSLADLNSACSRVGRTSQRVLESNAASSLVGAARVLGDRRPELRERSWALARLLLEEPGLAEGGVVRPRASLPRGVGGGMEHDREAFMRSGCCLFDRLPGHGLCPDCVRAEHRAEQVTPGH